MCPERARLNHTSFPSPECVLSQSDWSDLTVFPATADCSCVTGNQREGVPLSVVRLLMGELMVLSGLGKKGKIPRCASPPSLNTPKSIKKVGDENSGSQSSQPSAVCPRAVCPRPVQGRRDVPASCQILTTAPYTQKLELHRVMD